jgi:hypothetical protein
VIETVAVRGSAAAGEVTAIRRIGIVAYFIATSVQPPVRSAAARRIAELFQHRQDEHRTKS